jgi:hypothetical protein
MENTEFIAAGAGKVAGTRDECVYAEANLAENRGIFEAVEKPVTITVHFDLSFR